VHAARDETSEAGPEGPTAGPAGPETRTAAPAGPGGRTAGPARPPDLPEPEPVPAEPEPVPAEPEPVPAEPEPVPAWAGRDAAAGRRLAGATGRRLAGERLRRTILAGDMAPGQRLVEEELAGTLGVTRASLRAALFDLAAEGLVERIPNRGARVRPVTLDEAVAITECRMVLEGLCAAKAAERVTEAEAERLRQIAGQMERSVADGEPLKYSALNHELHRLVREISGQKVAAGLLERLNGQLVRHQFQLSLRPGRPQASLPEHLAIIAAVAGRRPAEAEEATRRHLRSVITALLDQHELDQDEEETG
jgi:DNA-binding GntR family transcriptional regulator